MGLRNLSELLSSQILVAPMGGGPSTVALVIAAAEASALGFLAAGYKTADAMRNEIKEVRDGTSGVFGVNLFVPGTPSATTEELKAYVESLAPDGEALHEDVGEPEWDDDDWAAKIEVLLTSPPPLVSFTFGCPSPEVVRALQRAGAVVAITVTRPQEALMAAGVGADCLCVQGAEAGAHQSVFANSNAPAPSYDLLTLIRSVSEVTDLPQIGTGGIMNANSVGAVLSAGAVAVQCGTAFLRSPESGAHAAYKDALASSCFTSTAITRSFSGRPARGLINRFMLDHPYAPAAYPEINNATRPLRAAAARAGDLERMSLWAGCGFKEATALPTAEIIRRLCP